MKQWFVVNTKAKNENRASHNLGVAAYEVFTPKLRVRKYKEGRFVDVIEAMFPNYIFVRFDPVDDYHMVKYARGVRTIVSLGGRIVPLQDDLIEFLRGKLVEGVASVQKKRYTKGEKIMIKEGPFKGLNGIFERELEGEERVLILLDGITYYAKMIIDSDLITAE